MALPNEAKRLGNGISKLWAAWRRRRAEAELRAMSDRELHDLGLGRGGIPHAARHGRPREGEMEHYG